MFIEDIHLGQIEIKRTARAKNITVSFVNRILKITVPLYFSQDQINNAIDDLRPKLIEFKDKESQNFHFTPYTDFVTFSFQLKIIENQQANFYSNLKNKILSISCPLGTDYESIEIQHFIRKTIETAMKIEARRVLSKKVQQLADNNNVKFNTIKISSSRKRWGSCSSKKNINLSFYCMLLPECLIDYVILHELSHTIEMNHSKRFWSTLDIMIGKSSKELDKELKNFRTKF